MHPRTLSLFATRFNDVGRCFETFQGLYPLLMVMTVWRTFRVRVHPGILLIFNAYARPDNSSTSDSHGFFSKVKTSVIDDQSLLSWADKGQWETGSARDVQVVREGDWFRIGFEPMFVDFTRPGTWFLLFSLIEVRPVQVWSDLAFPLLGAVFSRGSYVPTHQA